MEAQMQHHHYRNLLLMAMLSFISMYVLMYAMVDRFENVFPNHNQFYMAAIMTAPMVIIELFVMGSMYKNKKLNLLLIGLSALLLFLFFFFIRQQTGINDRQFLKSMIPHHAGAILMCEKANLVDPEIKELCVRITASQLEEIDQMKAILSRK